MLFSIVWALEQDEVLLFWIPPAGAVMGSSNWQADKCLPAGFILCHPRPIANGLDTHDLGVKCN